MSKPTPSKSTEVAIIGMSCRFPGEANSYQSFWDLLLNRFDAFTKVPKNRWDIRKFYSDNPNKPGKAYVNEAAFLTAPFDEFDPLFFGISPREAECIDPQQRFLMEVSWEAFEDAGLQIEKLRGSRTGVFVGGFCLDNKLLQLSNLNRHNIDSNTPTSSTMAIMSNRLSYVFDLKGPSLTIDTACSSSLVATHFACESILNGESDMAIAAGANIMIRPEYSVAMSKGGFLSKHGRCKTFDEEAAGYARGEGVGVLMLKSLEKALADGDRIHAIISATGVNQDGQTTGMALPNQDAQEALIRQVYNKAKIAADDIDYVEAHGTGTQAGDVTEITALNNVLSSRTKQQKIYIGSVKTNIGHLEAGAGVAGLIKTTLSLKHKTIVSNLHFNTPNPKIDFNNIVLQVPVETAPWPNKDENSRFASVNSFGYGGTNAHAVLRSYSKPSISTTPAQDVQQKLMPVCFSASGRDALKDLAKQYSSFLKDNLAINFSDLVYSLNQRRSHLKDRLCLVANSAKDITEKLDSYLKQGFAEGLVEATANTGKLVFVYTGMGPQWHAMGKELYEQNNTFKEEAKRCDSVFKKIAGWSILDELFKQEDSSRMTETAIAQPANFVIQIALTAVLAEWGIRPDAVVGHSVGEVAAAYVAGSLNLEDALVVSYHRSRLQQTLAGKGGMLAVGLNEAKAQNIITSYGDKVSIAAVNSPNAVTLAGDSQALKSIAKDLEQQEVFNRLLQVEVPYHSPVMDEIYDELKDVLAHIKPEPATITLYSTVTGTCVEGQSLNAEYWWKNVRQSVRFADATVQIMNDGYQHFLEVGPHPVLKNSIQECAVKTSKRVSSFQTLNRKQPNEIKVLLESLATLHCHGIDTHLAYFNAKDAQYIDLPSYPWQKQRYWRESEVSRQERLGNEGPVWFYQDLRLPVPAWEVEFSKQFFPYVVDHKVQGNVVFPGAAYIEAGLQLHNKINNSLSCIIENIQFHSMLVSDENQVQRLQLMYQPHSNRFTIHSANDADQLTWRLHADGRILAENFASDLQSIDLAELKNRCPLALDVEKEYAQLKSMGLEYGPYFRTIREWYSGDNQVLSKLRLQPAHAEDIEQFILHPAMVDGCFQSMVSLVKQQENLQQGSYVPVSIKKIKVYAPIGAECWAYARLTKVDRNFIHGDIQFISTSGILLAEIAQIKCQAVSNDTSASLDKLLYALEWQQQNFKFSKKMENASNQSWLLLLDQEQRQDPLVLNLAKKISKITFAVPGLELKRDDENSFQVPFEKEGFTELLKQVKPDQILYLYQTPVDNTASNSEQVLNSVWPLTALSQALHQTDLTTVTLTMVSSKSQSVNIQDDFKLHASPMPALLRLISNEFPHLKTYAIDSDAQTEITDVVDDIIYKGQDTVIGWRENKRFIRKLIKQRPKQSSDNYQPLALAKHNVRLVVEQPGDLDSLRFYEVNLAKPKAGEVQVKVHASALNFKDLLKVYGRIADDVIADTFFGNTLGMEAAGVITAVGDGVNQFSIGDEVITPVPSAFCAYATVPTTYVITKPKCLSFEQAPVMIGYLAAYRGLIDIADLQAGEKILIHNATGGVGVAAIQIAKWRGAEIYATAGTEEKRAYLKAQGIKHIYNSRSLHFIEEIRQDTQGYGVDVVLNAIAGVALTQSFNLLAAYGRFIEIGKRDIAEDTGLPMQAFNRNLTFASVDIDRMLVERTSTIQRLLLDISNRFNQGDFKPSPIHAYKASNVKDAFLAMSKSQHMGKIVLNFDEDYLNAVPLATKILSVSKQGSYLVTGGTDGFGLEVGKWLAEQGAARVVLISRSGAKSPTAQNTIAELQKNYQIEALAVDVTNKPALQNLIADMNSSAYPLKGIIHSAMVLDDAFLTDMSKERYRKVLAPKIDGVMNLHELTKSISLDFFVSFSSISSLIGNNGQAAYVVANNFLDNFAYFRHSQQLPATTINWGVLSETGVVARNQDVGDLLEKAGIKGFNNQKALSILGQVLDEKPVEIGAFDVDWQNWSALYSTLSRSAMFSDLAGNYSGGFNDEVRLALLDILMPLSKDERQANVATRITKQISEVLKLPIDKIDTHTSINAFGIDSLVAVELVSILKKTLAIEITVVDLLAGPTIEQLSNMVLDRLITEEDELLTKIDELTEEELDALLREEQNETSPA